MKPTVSNGIAVFSIQGFIDGTNAPFFITLDDIRYTQKLNVNLVLISLAKVVYFNVNGLEILSEALKKFRKTMQVDVGFCDYDKKKYEAILQLNKNHLEYSLFHTLSIASLFASTCNENGKTLLIWNDDTSQRNTLAIDLFERGHNPVVAQNKEEFLKRRNDSKTFDQIIEYTNMGFYDNKIAAKVAGNAIIYTVKGFLDAELSNLFDINYHKNSLNVDFKLFVFDATKVVSMNIHALNFFTRLATAAAEYDATIAIVGLDFGKVPQAYRHTLEDAGMLFFDLLGDLLKNKELLKELTGTAGTQATKKRAITKVLVNNLPSFIEATVSSFEMMTNSKAVKKSAAINPLEVDENQNLFCASIGFFGDIDGIIMLIFPKIVAQKACALLLGEENPSEDETLDTIAEFVNIIGGRVKAILSEKEGLDVSITLPRTYNDIQTLLELSGPRKGAQVNFALGTHTFTFFLTR